MLTEQKNWTEHIFIDIKLRPLTGNEEHKAQKQSIYMIYLKYMSTKSKQKDSEIRHRYLVYTVFYLVFQVLSTWQMFHYEWHEMG